MTMMIPQAAMPVHAALPGYEKYAAVLLLEKPLLTRLDQLATVAINAKSADPFLQRLVFDSNATIRLYGADFLHWISCMGSWGKAWHGMFAADHVLPVPGQLGKDSPEFKEIKFITTVDITVSGPEFPYISWVPQLDNTACPYTTTPRPFSDYTRFVNDRPDYIRLEREYVRSDIPGN